MTSFKNVFKVMSRNKYKSIYYTLGIQLVLVIVLGLWTMLGSNTGAFSFFMIWGLSSFFIDLAYIVLSAWQAEKEYNYQTWRLIPISSTKFYLANILTLIVNGIYTILIQLAMGLLTFIPVFFDAEFGRFSKTVVKQVNDYDFGTFIYKIQQVLPIQIVITFFLMILFFVILVYTMITTVDLSSRVIVNFLSDRHVKFLSIVVNALLMIILVVFISNIFDYVYGLVHQFFNYDFDLGSMWLTNSLLLVFVALFSAVNIGLLSKFHEAKA